MYYDHIETWYEVHISNLKNLFCHHYTAKLAIFRTKFPGFQVLFSHSSTLSEPLNFTLDIPRHWGISKMGNKFMECVHIFALSWKRDLDKCGYNLNTTRDMRYSI